MIPYEELCAQLASWRSRNGLSNGASATPRVRELGAAPAPQYVPPSYSPSPVAYAAPVAAAAAISAPVQTSPVPQFTPPQGYGAIPTPYGTQNSPSGGYAQPAELPPVDDEAPPLFGTPDPGDMTEIHGTAVPPRDDQTGEIDIDAIDVVDEEEAP